MALGEVKGVQTERHRPYAAKEVGWLTKSVSQGAGKS
jgi:hypothetical protein